MKKITAIAICALAMAVIASGCVSVNLSPSLQGGSIVSGSGSPEVFTFNVGEIKEILIEFQCNIEYYSSRSDVVTLEIQPNLMEYISVEESDGILAVRSTMAAISIPTGRSPVLTVWAPELSRVSLRGAGVFTAHDKISVDSFSIDLAGAGNGNAELEVGTLSVSMSGAGGFTLSGTAETADFSLAGAGSIEALDLQTRHANVNLAGVGSVRISCSENLRVSAGGVGSVEYRGSPTVDTSHGGLVSVRRVD